MKNKPKIIKSYHYITAGKTWLIKDVIIKKALDGTEVVPGTEILRMQKIVANTICGAPGALKPEELEFLCDITQTKYIDIADYLGVTKGNITFWKKAGRCVPLNESLRIKKWFWYKLFGKEILKSHVSVPLEIIENDFEILNYLHETAIEYCNVSNLRKSS